MDLGVKGLSVVWDLTGKSGKNQVSAEETEPISCPISSYSQKVFFTLYTLTSVCIFSILFSTHFLMVLTRRICLTAKNFLFDDHFLYSSNV